MIETNPTLQSQNESRSNLLLPDGELPPNIAGLLKSPPPDLLPAPPHLKKRYVIPGRLWNRLGGWSEAAELMVIVLVFLAIGLMLFSFVVRPDAIIRYGADLPPTTLATLGFVTIGTLGIVIMACFSYENDDNSDAELERLFSLLMQIIGICTIVLSVPLWLLMVFILISLPVVILYSLFPFWEISSAIFWVSDAIVLVIVSSFFIINRRRQSARSEQSGESMDHGYE